MHQREGAERRQRTRRECVIAHSIEFLVRARGGPRRISREKERSGRGNGSNLATLEINSKLIHAIILIARVEDAPKELANCTAAPLF